MASGSTGSFRRQAELTMELTAAEKRVMIAVAKGWTLKSHRYLDGRKEYRLHPLGEGEAETVARETVEALREQDLIDSNKKFPAATYLLTDRGRAAVEGSGFLPEQGPLTASGWR